MQLLWELNVWKDLVQFPAYDKYFMNSADNKNDNTSKLIIWMSSHVILWISDRQYITWWCGKECQGCFHSRPKSFGSSFLQTTVSPLRFINENLSLK